MSLDEIRRIQNHLKQLKELRELMRAFGGRSQSEKHEMTINWLNDHSSDLPAMPPDQLESLREAADYDKQEWDLLLTKLTEPDNDDRPNQ